MDSLVWKGCGIERGKRKRYFKIPKALAEGLFKFFLNYFPEKAGFLNGFVV